jgi:hypothetical protein
MTIRTMPLMAQMIPMMPTISSMGRLAAPPRAFQIPAAVRGLLPAVAELLDRELEVVASPGRR